MRQSLGASAPYALVVDDNGIIRMGAMDVLEEAGFHALEARDGDEALTLLGEWHGSIVLLFTGVKMPGSRDGFAIARETARQWPHISIVIASGKARPAAGQLPDGVCFIGKPFSAEIVHAHLEKILPSHRYSIPQTRN